LISSNSGHYKPSESNLRQFASWLNERQVFSLACLGNPDPVGMKVYCPTGKETFDDEKTEEAPPRRDRGEAA